MACCQAAHLSSGPANLPSHHWGAAANKTTPQATAATASRSRWRRPWSARVSRAAAHHTQWCDQDMGEMSRAAKALSDSAQQSCRAASARRMPWHATITTRADSASQAAWPGRVCGSSPARARTAWMHWLAAWAESPIRPVWKTAVVQ
jgi:hypothetical protein